MSKVATKLLRQQAIKQFYLPYLRCLGVHKTKNLISKIVEKNMEGTQHVGKIKQTPDFYGSHRLDTEPFPK